MFGLRFVSERSEIPEPRQLSDLLQPESSLRGSLKNSQKSEKYYSHATKQIVGKCQALCVYTLYLLNIDMKVTWCNWIAL